MKKRFLTFILTIATMLMCIFGLSACGGNVEFKINFVVENEVYATVSTSGNEVISMPENPTKDDYTFDGWYWDENTWEKPFTANSLLDAPLSSDMKVYAKFNKNHTHEYTPTTTEPTCTEKGLITYTCSCGDSYTEDIPAIGHDEKTHEAKAPTCTEIGWEEYVTCEREGCDYSTYKEIPATGVHTWDKGEETKAPTCTKEGETTYTCTVCKTTTKTEPIDKLRHEYAEKWSSSATYHWHECKCGDKDGEEKHTAGAPATATTPQTCTVCGYVLQVETGILFKTLTVDGTKVYGKVSNTTTEFSFVDEIIVKGNAKFVVALDKNANQTVITKKVDLQEGDNVIWIFETLEGEITNTYTVTIRRRPMYDVTFDVDGGTTVAKQVIEEDYLATEPETTRTGYTFTGWDYDFTQPITKTTKITASWVANTDTKYTVNYYLQNLDDSNYTLHETVELTGETDATATAEMKDYAHFTYNASKSTISGNINGDGGQALSVYYTRNTYTLSINNSSAGTITNSGTYKYGVEEFEVMVSLPDLGYTFLGWYNEKILLSVDLAYTFTATQNVMAMFESKAEMSNFKFTSTTTTCEITSIKDKAVTEIVVPDYVTSISKGAFSGCSSLESITIPFVGAKAGVTASDTYQYPFGYIFGTSSYTGGTSTTQHYYGYSTSSTTYNYYYIPTSLKSVRIIGGNILYGAFYNCDSLTSVVIGDSVTSIGSSAFYNCSSLTSVVIGDGVTSIGDSAFKNCSSLTSVVIPDSVTSIVEGAFSGCSSLESITIPFVGGSRKTASNTYQYPFGYIFGTSSYTGGTATQQAYYGSSTSSTTYGYYYIPTSLKSVTVTGGNILYSAFYNCSSLTSVVIGDGVTSIGSSAFYNCSSLTSVVIGNSVTSIGSSAFKNCSSLTAVYITDIEAWCNVSFDGYYTANPLNYAENLYLNGELVTELVIPDSVTSIGNYAFYNCDSLTSVVIPDSVISIGSSAFYNCSSLTSVEIPDSVTSIGDKAFYSCDSLTSVVIGDGVTSIGEYAFKNCDSLTSVVIPDSVTSIGSYAFDDCYKLVEVVNKSTHITITKGSSSNGDVGYYALTVYNSGDAFTGTKLSNDNGYIVYTDGEEKILVDYNGIETVLVLPSYITKINQNAFYNCDSLTSVVIGNSVTSIGSSAFYSCDSLTSVVIGDNVTSIGYSAFHNCSSLTSVVIPDSVISIGGGAFYNCSSLTSVVIGNSVTSIGDSAFYSCDRLTSVVIGNSVTSIGSSAFYSCDSLTSVVIPDSVTSIVEGAFSGCSSLESITIPFVGGSRKTASDTYQYPFGYIFGTSEYTGGTKTPQSYYGYSTSSTTSATYYIPNSLKSVTVTGGDILRGAFYNCYRLTSVVIGDSVTTIGKEAFYSCTSLTNVVIGDSVTSIGDYAFYNCDSLTSVVIGNSVTSIGDSAFYNCDSLTSVVIGNSVTSIGDSAFYSCDSLTSVVIGNSVTSIGSSAFYSCDSLTSVVIGNSVTSIGSSAFKNCSSLTSVVIPDSVTSIGESAFSGCSALESITIPFVGGSRKTASNTYQCPFGYIFGTSEYAGGTATTQSYYGSSTSSTTSATYYIPNSLKSVTVTGGDILRGAFYNCSSLTSVVIGDGVTSIGSWAFYNCSSLTSVVIGDNVTSIGYSAFRNCDSLTSVVIGNGVTSIDESAFYDCNSLTSVVIPDSVTSIGNSAFDGCCNLTSVVIPDSVTSIGERAFAGCCNLTSVEIGDSVTSIGDCAFLNCSSLTSVVIPDSVTSIGESAFEDCDSLTSVVIGDSVTSIGRYAFGECSNLTSVYYKGTASDWSKISINPSNTKLTNATRYYYSETKPTTSGKYWHYVDGVPTKW